MHSCLKENIAKMKFEISFNFSWQLVHKKFVKFESHYMSNGLVPSEVTIYVEGFVLKDFDRLVL